MALITKITIASVLGVDATDISDSVYTWATKQFYALTGVVGAEVSKTYRKYLQSSTSIIKLPFTNIKTINSIKLDNIAQSFTLHEDLKLNPDTGILWFANGFGGGQLAEINYTINAVTLTDLHDYLMTLLVARALSMFTPEKIAQVKKVRIGNFSKEYGNASNNLEDYITVTNDEIARVIRMLKDDDGSLASEFIQ